MKQAPLNKGNLFLKPKEQMFVSMAVVSMVEQLENTSKNPRINWTPEARKTLKDMLEAGNDLKAKLTKLGFDMTPLPPFEEGDEKEFLTKES